MVLEAIGIRNSTDLRRKRQIEGTLENCTITGVSNNFIVSPDTTELTVNASMFNGNAICSIAHYAFFSASFTVYEYQVQVANDLGVGELSPATRFSTPQSGMF